MLKVSRGALSSLVVLALIAPAANARSRTRFFHRVDLRTGVATKMVELEAGRPNLRVVGAQPADCWKGPPGGGARTINIDVDSRFDPRHTAPEKAWERSRLS